ncbi:LuxR C-terminal-related transcriptional regulator [Caballeronia temeraria]|nr:LuxR C-terminal-related transcriptional regulator [Caballeronia temeraria]
MKILLTGPAGLFREGVAALLRGFAHGAEVQTLDRIADRPEDESKPDCIVVDGDRLRDMREELDAIRDHVPATPVIVLLSMVKREHVDELIAAGVAGCVEKSASAELLFGAVGLVLAGGVSLPRSLLSPERSASPARLESVEPEPDLHLTPRQIEVLALLARGRSNKMIARELDVAEATVKTHLTTIFKALNVSSRGEASAVAARMAKIRDTQVDHAINGQLPVARLLARMDSQHFRPGEILFRKGEPSGQMFYVEKGTVRLSELGIELGAGTVLGEIGLFSPEHRRTSTVICKTDCDMRTVSAADAIRLYYQDPEFALYLVRLIASRLQADKERNA